MGSNISWIGFLDLFCFCEHDETYVNTCSEFPILYGIIISRFFFDTVTFSVFVSKHIYFRTTEEVYNIMHIWSYLKFNKNSKFV